MIPLMKHAFLHEEETKKALGEFILQADRLSMDQKCREFEVAFAAYQGRKDAILFNSGGSANLAMLQALKNLGRLKAGNRVAFSALTWSTNTMPIIQLGMVPVALDVRLDTLNVTSKELLERLAEVDVQAFFVTNVLGFTGDMGEIKRICDERGIIVLEDNCESLGTELPEGKAGNFSLGSSFSFFVAHHMSTIEGGMVCTDDPEFADMLRIARANGWDRNLSPERQEEMRAQYGVAGEFEAKYTFYDLGFNMRPTEITGFLGLNQMQYLEDTIARREGNYLRLEKTILSNPDFVPLDHSHITRLSTFAFPIVCVSAEERAKYIARLQEAQVELRPMICGNMQRQPFYRKYVPQTFELPNADAIHERGFYMGNYPELTEEDLQTLECCLTPA